LGVRERISSGDGALHALRSGGEHDFRTESFQQHPALEAHRFWHGENQLVTFDSGDERQRDAGIAAGRFDERGFSRRNFAGLFGLVDHAHADAVFYAVVGVETF